MAPGIKNNVMLIDGAREVLGLSLNSLGYSLNSKTTNNYVRLPIS